MAWSDARGWYRPMPEEEDREDALECSGGPADTPDLLVSLTPTKLMSASPAPNSVSRSPGHGTSLKLPENDLTEDDASGITMGHVPDCRRPAVEDMSLEQLLHGHARQAALIADRLGQSEYQLLELMESPACPSPEEALVAAERLGELWRTASEEMKTTIRLITELERPPQAPIQVGIVSVSPDRIEGPRYREIGPRIRGELEGR